MNNQISNLERVKSQLIQVKNKIETSGDKLPIELGIMKILIELESELNKKSPDRKHLEKEAYGIFRLVTESYTFEQSSIGQELLILRGEVRKFVSTIT